MVNKWCLQSFREPSSREPGMTDLGGYPGSDRAGHAGAAEAAISGRILGQVLLVIVLGEIKLTRRGDLRGDRTQPLCCQGLLVGRLRGIRGFALRVIEGVDG